MEFVEKLDPQKLSDLVSLFILGFVFRAVVRFVRNSPKEEEVHTIVLAIVWSVMLRAPLYAWSIDFPSWVAKDHKVWIQPITLASYVIYAAGVGLLWGIVGTIVQDNYIKWRENQLKKRKWLGAYLKPYTAADAHTYTLSRFLRDAGDTQVRVQLKGPENRSYVGCILRSDSGADLPEDPKLILEHVYYQHNGNWEKSEGIKRLMLNLSDIETMAELIEKKP